MPLVSVILPCYFSDDTLAEALTALRRQFFGDFEVIVVNSSQEPRTAATAAAFPEVRFIQSPQRLFPHAARNLGVTHAQGRLLIFSDPDCTADPHWIGRLVDGWRTGHQNIGGAMGLKDSSWLGTGIHICKFHPCIESQKPGPRWILPTANVAYSRELWDKIGPFSTAFAGDAIQSWRTAAAGTTPWFEPDAIVYHTQDQTLKAFLKQRLSRGREFGNLRAIQEGWSTSRLFAHIVCTPLLPAVVLLRAAADTWRSGWFGRFLLTLPIQIAGHAAWSFGEAAGFWNALRKPQSAPDFARS